MSKNGLLDIGILSFVFTPLVVTITLLFFLLWTRIRACRTLLPVTDTPGLLLSVIYNGMPADQIERGTAMMTELSRISRWSSRWWIALGCAWVAMFPPRGKRAPRRSSSSQNPLCGALAVALPPLGLPFIYFTAIIVEAFGGSPFTQSSRWSNADAVIDVVQIIVKLLFLFLLAGLPLGIAGLLRRERLRWLSVLGMVSSLSITSYFILVMHFVDGGAERGLR